MNLKPSSLAPLAMLAVACLPVAAADWPQFRGPDGQGHSSERGLPTTWSETENIVWKTPIEGLGWSSPVVAGKQIWVTTAIEKTRSLRAACIDLDSGQVVHDVEVFKKADLGSINAKNSHASPTPLIEGDRVYVHFGAHGTACLTRDGQIVWRNDEIHYDHRHGPAGSPVVWRDLLLFSCDGDDVQFVVALDKRNGHVRWKTDREGSRMAYSTPLLIRTGGVDQLISSGGNQVVAYEPATGKEIWKFRYDGYSVVPRPVFAHGLVILSSGYDTPTLYAIRPDGHGDVTDTHGQWTLRRAVPHNPSPLVVGDELYLLSDLGVASCVDARTGDPHWQLRIGGAFSASPLYADGKIYLTNEEGGTTVLAAGTTAKKLATNQIEGRTLASLATAGRSILLRSDKHLYRIEEGARQ
jgi:outer membrane protein assembly factor BamB